MYLYEILSEATHYKDTATCLFIAGKWTLLSEMDALVFVIDVKGIHAHVPLSTVQQPWQPLGCRRREQKWMPRKTEMKSMTQKLANDKK